MSTTTAAYPVLTLAPPSLRAAAAMLSALAIDAGFADVLEQERIDAERTLAVLPHEVSRSNDCYADLERERRHHLRGAERRAARAANAAATVRAILERHPSLRPIAGPPEGGGG